MTGYGASTDAATWIAVLVAVVIAFLVGVGLLQFSLTGNVGDLARNLSIGALLALFGAGFHRKWH
ncbi:hypothetical protein SY89_03240 [Halolamina pelagica]|uniref:DUF8073 domain-containing protein n=1 Tax=Halolamina pelagica TaxID=699431 RepID=A0A0P7H6K3_9EURY|nr:hypothetical protein [Halolamina pelagica]KPN29006.1 hypothetical protein SY89_03240 [Halolamina pelagica]